MDAYNFRDQPVLYQKCRLGNTAIQKFRMTKIYTKNRNHCIRKIWKTWQYKYRNSRNIEMTKKFENQTDNYLLG